MRLEGRRGEKREVGAAALPAERRAPTARKGGLTRASWPLSLPRRRSGRPARLTRGAAERGPLDRPQATDGGTEKRQRPQRVVRHRLGGAEAADGFLRPRTASQSHFPDSGQPLASRPR